MGTFRVEERSWNRFILLAGPGYFIVGRLWVLHGILAGIGYHNYCRAESGTLLQDGCPYHIAGQFGVLYYRTVGRSGVLCYRTGVRTLL